MITFIYLLLFARAQNVVLTYRIRTSSISVRTDGGDYADADGYTGESDITHDVSRLPLPSCFLNTVDSLNETQNLANHPEQYYQIDQFTWGNAVINRLKNNNSIPQFCYYSSDIVCDAVQAIMNNQDSACTILGSIPMTVNQAQLPTADLMYEEIDIVPVIDYEGSLMTVTLDTTGATQEDAESAIEIAKHVCFMQAKTYQDTFLTIQSIYDANTARADENHRIVKILRQMLYCWAAALFIVTMFWFAWCIPITRLFLCCKLDCCMKLPLFGPDWLDFFMWFGFWVGMFIWVGLAKNVIVSGIILFTVSFIDLCVSAYYCCRWKRHKCCGDCFEECCPPLNPNDPNKLAGVSDLMSKDIELTTTKNSGSYSKRMPSRISTYVDDAGRKVYNTKGEGDRDVCECRCGALIGGSGRRCDKLMGHYCFPLHSSPDKMHRLQGRTVFTLALVVSLLAFMTALVWFVMWDVTYYKALIRSSRTIEEEYAPDYIMKIQALLYAEPGKFEQAGWDSKLFDFGNSVCGSHFDEKLSDEEKTTSIQKDYIDKYSIAMDIFQRTEYTEYSSVNDWFSRGLQNLEDGVRPVRPIAGKDDPHIVVSPADCRVVVFNEVWDDQLIWIKSRQYTTNKLLELEPGNENSAYWQKCPQCVNAFQSNGDNQRIVQMGMFRLAPQDYHRYHAPVTGSIVFGFEAEGKLHSVSADAITSENEAILNKRYVIFIQPDDWPRHSGEDPLLAYVIIGAVCVGSINLQAPADSSDCALTIIPGQESSNPDFINDCVFQKGECTGTFKFGGSTIAMVFQQDAIIWDQDLQFSSYFPVEHVINMGSQIARVNPNPPS